MKDVTYIVQCPHCLYDEEQILKKLMLCFRKFNLYFILNLKTL